MAWDNESPNNKNEKEQHSIIRNIIYEKGRLKTYRIRNIIPSLHNSSDVSKTEAKKLNLINRN